MADSIFDVHCTGLERGEPAEACAMVIFGAAGDLTRKALVPALYELSHQNLLPESFVMVGFARRDWDDDAFREEMRAAARESVSDSFDEESWTRLGECLYFIKGDFESPNGRDYARLAERLTELREAHGLPDNVLFHLAAPPDFFATIVDGLAESGLSRERDGWRRLVIEKPFGRDEASAIELENVLQRSFREDQVYRIDHFLGKETVQNVLVFRFANPSYEPVWNRNYIDHVQITAAEDGGIRKRGKFYEATGVVRDMVQNHLLQLLCAVAIEPPLRFDANGLRNETVKVLEAIRPIDIRNACVAGQYAGGTKDGKRMRGYREEEDVATDSETATFAALKLEIDNWRWAGVPFYLRTGKRLARKLTEIIIRFKPTPHSMFEWDDGTPQGSEIAFRLAPHEGIIQSFLGKQPGPGLCVRPVRMRFLYADAFGIEEPPGAYAWLLLDAMQGDQTLFARADWIRRAWSIVDPLIQHWETHPPADLPNYEAGSWGPRTATDLLARDGRQWRAV